MRRTTILMLGALTLLALSAFGTTTASALPTEGPFLHVNGAKTALNVKFEVEGVGGPSQFFGTTGGVKLKTECEKDHFSGKQWNGANYGEGEGTGTFEGCQLSKQETNGAEVHLCFLPNIVAEVVSRSDYHQETEVTGKTETIQLEFFPKPPNANFTVLKTGAECGVLKNKEINVAGSVAANISKNIERAEGEEGTFSTTELVQEWVWQPKPAEVIAMGLKASSSPATIVGSTSIKIRGGGKKFGAFNS